MPWSRATATEKGSLERVESKERKRKMYGKLFHEIDVNAPASDAWEIYGTLKFAKLAEEQLSSAIEKIEVVEGDGGVGTVINLVFKPGTPMSPGYKEKYTKVDNENRMKVAEVVEGGYLNLGFNFFRILFEIVEKGDDWCTIKTTVEYDVKEEAAAEASKIVSIEPLAILAEATKNALLQNKAQCD